jgi:serine/threonine protein kinase
MEKYQILEQIGEGGFAKVYKVKNKEDNNLYALKKYKREEDDGFDDNPERIKQEIDGLKKYKHPNIIQYFEDFKYHDAYYVVLELIEETLSNYLKRTSTSISDIKNYMKQVLSAISYLHSNNVVHDDIKPQNILINYGEIKLIDGCYTKVGKIIDIETTRPYASPETLFDEYITEDKKFKVYTDKKGEVYDTIARKENDVWSIGCLLYFIIYKEILYNENTENTSIRCIEELMKIFGYIKFKFRFEIFDKYKKIKRKEFEMKDHLQDEDLYDLLNKLLNTNYRERIKVDDALNHKFITKD